jgi:hypothetical protein
MQIKLELQSEIWKDVKSFEGTYQVSNLGRVKRIDNSKIRNKRYCGEYYFKGMDNGCGYLRIKLTKNNISKRYMLHRLIAEAFIPNPQNKPQVNHIDGNKQNNSISNLEWVTRLENVRHAWEIGLCEHLREISRITGKRTIHLIPRITKNVLDTESGIFYESIKLCWDLNNDYLKCNYHTFKHKLAGRLINKTKFIKL